MSRSLASPEHGDDRGEGNGSALVARYKAIIVNQERTIAELRTELERLRGQEAAPAGATTAPRPASTAAVPASPPTRARHRPQPRADAVPGTDFTIVFDGGAIGNPGRGYGSYQIVGGEGIVAQRRLEYGDRVTNNQAEYRTLIGALEDLSERLGGATPRTAIAVRGDSQLVVEQVCGRWKVRHAELRPLYERAVTLLGRFAKSDVAWHRRDASVRVLGH